MSTFHDFPILCGTSSCILYTCLSLGLTLEEAPNKTNCISIVILLLLTDIILLFIGLVKSNNNQTTTKWYNSIVIYPCYQLYCVWIEIENLNVRTYLLTNWEHAIKYINIFIPSQNFKIWNGIIIWIGHLWIHPKIDFFDLNSNLMWNRTKFLLFWGCYNIHILCLYYNYIMSYTT